MEFRKLVLMSRRAATTALVLFIVSLLSSLVVTLLAGCGFVGEDAADVAPVLAPDYAAPCRLPDWETVDLDTATDADIDGWLACGIRQIESLEPQVRGRSAGELSVGELRSLNNHGLIGFAMNEEPLWGALKLGVGILHPEGRAAIRWDTLKGLLRFGQRQRDIVTRTLRMRGEFDVEQLFDWLAVSEEAIGFISDKWTLPIAEVRALATDLSRSSLGTRFKFKEDSVRKYLEPLWLLKSQMLDDPGGEGIWSTVKGSSIKKAALTISHALASRQKTVRWCWAGMRPNLYTAAIEEEMRGIILHAIHYFEDNQFATLDTQLLQWAIRRLDPKGTSYTLVPDVVRILQRLYPSANGETSGFWIPQIIPLLRGLQEVPTQMRRISDADWDVSFGHGQHLVRRHQARKLAELGDFANVILATPVGTWSKSPTGFNQWTRHWGHPDEDLLDWRDILRTLVVRQMIRQVFSTFDRNSDGKILYSGNEEETGEAMDLAYTILRVISSPAEPRRNAKAAEELVPEWLPVKPGTLSGLLGLLGDRWYAQGNQNGLLETDELTLSLLTYEGVQQVRADVSAPGFVQPQDLIAQQTGTSFFVDRTVYRRPEMVRGGLRFVEFEYPYLDAQIAKLPNDIGVKFFDALIAKPKRSPVRALSTKDFSKLETIVNPAYQSEFLPVSAVMVGLNQLLLACDTKGAANGGDGLWDWDEMDCALPLAVDAALQIVTSSMLDLAPGVNDGTRVVLAFLNKPGPGLTVLKLLASQGGYRGIDAEALFKQAGAWVDTSVVMDKTSLGRFLQRTEGMVVDDIADWESEATTRYGACDENSDAKFAEKELDCMVEQTVTYWLGKFMPPLFARMAVIKLSDTEEGKIVKLALKATAAVLGEATPGELPNFPVSSEPSKLMSLMAEVLQRSEPLKP